MDNILLNQNIRAQQIQNSNVGIFCLLFLLNPFWAVIIGAILVFNSRRTIPLSFWLVLTAIWISLLNINKVPESDEIQYIRFYLNVGREPLYKAIFEFGATSKEPVYGLIQTACYYIFSGNVSLFIFTVSFISYVTLFLAVKIVLMRAGQGVKSVIFGVVCVTFFNQFFYISAHLIRQVMAFSIALYAIAQRCRDGKVHWLPTVCAPLIHTSAGIFVFLSLIPAIFHKMRFKQYLLLSLPLIAVSIGSFVFGAYMVSIMGSGGAGYAFERLSSDASDGLQSDPVIVMVSIIPLLVISLITLYRLSKNRTNDSPLYAIVHIFIFLSLMVLGLSQQPLLQYRFTFVTYQMLPFLLPLLLTKSNRMRNPYYIVVGALFIMRFLLTLQYSKFTYNITATEFLYLPLPAYFF